MLRADDSQTSQSESVMQRMEGEESVASGVKSRRESLGRTSNNLVPKELRGLGHD